MKPVYVKFANDPTKTAEENAADRQNMEKKGKAQEIKEQKKAASKTKK